MQSYGFHTLTLPFVLEEELASDHEPEPGISTLESSGASSLLLPAKAPLRCDGPNSSCKGQGANGMFVDPEERAFMLCRFCFFRLEKRDGVGDDTPQ